MDKCVFFDRDGILNKEIGSYVWKIDDFTVEEGILPLLNFLKEKKIGRIVITNQAGIAKGLYTHSDVKKLHAHFQQISDDVIDAFYYSPYHPNYSESLSRKPGSLLFEKSLSKFGLDPGKCWMIGDRERDLIPAGQLGIKTIRIFNERQEEPTIANHSFLSVKDIDYSLFMR